MLRPPLDTNANPVKHFSPTLWLPWWIWILAGVAIIAAGWYRRRSTLVLVVLALVIGVMFIEWPEHAIWNTRFLPFWMLTWAFVAAMGATEIARLVGVGRRRARTDGYATATCRTRAPTRGRRSRPRTTTTRRSTRTRARTRRGFSPSVASIADLTVGNRPRSCPIRSSAAWVAGSVLDRDRGGRRVRRALRVVPRQRRDEQQLRDRDPRLGRVELLGVREQGRVPAVQGDHDRDGSRSPTSTATGVRSGSRRRASPTRSTATARAWR